MFQINKCLKRPLADICADICVKNLATEISLKNGRNSRINKKKNQQGLLVTSSVYFFFFLNYPIPFLIIPDEMVKNQTHNHPLGLGTGALENLLHLFYLKAKLQKLAISLQLSLLFPDRCK